MKIFNTRWYRSKPHVNEDYDMVQIHANLTIVQYRMLKKWMKEQGWPRKESDAKED